MNVSPDRRVFHRWSEEEKKAIDALVAERVPRELAEKLVDEIGADREKLKAAAWVGTNLSGMRAGAR